MKIFGREIGRQLKVASFLSLILSCGCTLLGVSQSNNRQPAVVSSQGVSRVIKSLPANIEFGYSGLSFFDGKLYASSNVGLLEYKNGTLSRLYKWHEKDDVISGPWFDKANNSLWVFHNGINRLIRFDGKSWHVMDLPRPKDGYSRGDMLRGFRGVSNEHAFWLQGGDNAWRWDAGKQSWIDVAVPDTGLFVGIAPIKEKVFVIMQHNYTPSIAASPYNRPDKPNSDAVYFFENGEWRELPNKSGIKFFTKEIVVAKEAAYILTKNDEILMLSASELVPIKTLGKVEAIAAASSGNLLVSFRNDGIYEYANEWNKRFSKPYTSSEGEHLAYLTESNGQLAFAISAQPQRNGDSQVRYTGTTTLWISSGNQLTVASIGE